MKILISETQLNIIVNNILTENVDLSKMDFIGYHSSRKDLDDGFYKGNVLDSDEEGYEEVIRVLYLDIYGGDDNVEKNRTKTMNRRFKKDKFGFTFVSSVPITASPYQYGQKYKYGDHLYKVYGDGSEILLNDPNEVNATIVVHQNPLYFQRTEWSPYGDEYEDSNNANKHDEELDYMKGIASTWWRDDSNNIVAEFGYKGEIKYPISDYLTQIDEKLKRFSGYRLAEDDLYELKKFFIGLKSSN